MKYENFYSNVKSIAKSQGISIGDIEKKIGHQPGYLSRWSNMAKKTKETSSLESDKFPPLDVLYTISKMLGVGLEKLLEDDFTELSGDEITEYQFVLKLLSWTKARKIEWINGLDDEIMDAECLSRKQAYVELMNEANQDKSNYIQDSNGNSVQERKYDLRSTSIYYTVLPSLSEKIYFSFAVYSESSIWDDIERGTIIYELGFSDEMIYTRTNNVPVIRKTLDELHNYLIKEIRIKPTAKEKMNKFIQYELPEEE